MVELITLVCKVLSSKHYKLKNIFELPLATVGLATINGPRKISDQAFACWAHNPIWLEAIFLNELGYGFSFLTQNKRYRPHFLNPKKKKLSKSAQSSLAHIQIYTKDITHTVPFPSSCQGIVQSVPQSVLAQNWCTASALNIASKAYLVCGTG